MIQGVKLLIQLTKLIGELLLILLKLIYFKLEFQFILFLGIV